MSDSRKFEARYPGRCPACRGAIEVGDDLVMDDDQALHFECAGKAAMWTSVGMPREVCPRCFIEKSVSGACGCDQ